jgi:hypothetical protein
LSVARRAELFILFGMKTNIQFIVKLLALVSLVAAPLNRARAADEPSAFQLIKEGNRYVGDEVKNKVSQIRSEKSIGTLTPTIWYVVYYDEDATAKATEVKFAAGQKIAVKRPARVIERFSKAKLALPAEKLKIDSDKALKIAISEPIVKNLKLTASRLTLERMGVDSDLPVWKIRLWAAKLRNPNADVDIGELFISADEGKVIKNDLKIDRVD